jgi:hypothetical protein
LREIGFRFPGWFFVSDPQNLKHIILRVLGSLLHTEDALNLKLFFAFFFARIVILFIRFGVALS